MYAIIITVDHAVDYFINFYNQFITFFQNCLNAKRENDNSSKIVCLL